MSTDIKGNTSRELLLESFVVCGYCDKDHRACVTLVRESHFWKQRETNLALSTGKECIEGLRKRLNNGGAPRLTLVKDEYTMKTARSGPLSLKGRIEGIRSQDS